MAGRPEPRWGWHRLEPRAAAKLVADAHLPTRALVLDVGAGDGVVTEHLLTQRLDVIAVELHPARAQGLRDRFGQRVIVVRADAAALRLPRRPYHVVANPPFAVTSPLLRRLLQPGSRLVSAHLILQERAAVRWAGEGAPGARRWSRWFSVELGPRVPRSAFRPAPNVDARVLVIRRRPGC